MRFKLYMVYYLSMLHHLNSYLLDVMFENATVWLHYLFIPFMRFKFFVFQNFMQNMS